MFDFFVETHECLGQWSLTCAENISHYGSGIYMYMYLSTLHQLEASHLFSSFNKNLLGLQSNKNKQNRLTDLFSWLICLWCVGFFRRSWECFIHGIEKSLKKELLNWFTNSLSCKHVYRDFIFFGDQALRSFVFPLYCWMWTVLCRI